MHRGVVSDFEALLGTGGGTLSQHSRQLEFQAWR